MLNSKKVCFITCVNDEILYNECLRYIKNLDVPSGYEVESIAIRQSKSLSSGYNEAMKQTDAKYKVYIHQDAFIVDKGFMSKIIEVFEDKSIGLIGAAGCERLPINAVWWEARICYFNLYDNANGAIKKKKNSNSSGHPKVEGIDGLVMITQYDVTWREDVFDGWHFYDISQSLEFKRYSYKSVILNTTAPWILHDCGTIGIISDVRYEKYRNKLLAEYFKELFPLASIMERK